MPHDRCYAGIGSRSTPPEVLAHFRDLAARLEVEGWTLRSGGADGSDSAFEAGIRDLAHAEIYVPWPRFKKRAHGIMPPAEVWARARVIAADIHPAFRRLPYVEQALHTRNVFQVRGSDLASHDGDSQFVVCWTPDGAQAEGETNRDTGGTRTAIVLASRLGIPVVNFARDGARQRLSELLANLERPPVPVANQRALEVVGAESVTTSEQAATAQDAVQRDWSRG